MAAMGIFFLFLLFDALGGGDIALHPHECEDLLRRQSEIIVAGGGNPTGL